MDMNLQNKILSDFPHLFPDAGRRLMGLIDCGNGWFDLIYELCKKLEVEITSVDWPERFKLHVNQIKEKFGGLRFYMNQSTTRMDDLITIAEHKSENMCEVCGSTGRIYGERWGLQAACIEHAPLGPTEKLARYLKEDDNSRA